MPRPHRAAEEIRKLLQADLDMPAFELVSDFQPQADQINAIRELSEGLKRGDEAQVLLGVESVEQANSR